MGLSIFWVHHSSPHLSPLEFCPSHLSPLRTRSREVRCSHVSRPPPSIYTCTAVLPSDYQSAPTPTAPLRPHHLLRLYITYSLCHPPRTHQVTGTSPKDPALQPRCVRMASKPSAATSSAANGGPCCGGSCQGVLLPYLTEPILRSTF